MLYNTSVQQYSTCTTVNINSSRGTAEVDREFLESKDTLFWPPSLQNALGMRIWHEENKFSKETLKKEPDFSVEFVPLKSPRCSQSQQDIEYIICWPCGVCVCVHVKCIAGALLLQGSCHSSGNGADSTSLPERSQVSKET